MSVSIHGVGSLCYVVFTDQTTIHPAEMRASSVEPCRPARQCAALIQSQILIPKPPVLLQPDCQALRFAPALGEVEGVAAVRMEVERHLQGRVGHRLAVEHLVCFHYFLLLCSSAAARLCDYCVIGGRALQRYTALQPQTRTVSSPHCINTQHRQDHTSVMNQPGIVYISEPLLSEIKQIYQRCVLPVGALPVLVDPELRQEGLFAVEDFNLGRSVEDYEQKSKYLGYSILWMLEGSLRPSQTPSWHPDLSLWSPQGYRSIDQVLLDSSNDGWGQVTQHRVYCLLHGWAEVVGDRLHLLHGRSFLQEYSKVLTVILWFQYYRSPDFRGLEHAMLYTQTGQLITQHLSPDYIDNVDDFIKNCFRPLYNCCFVEKTLEILFNYGRGCLSRAELYGRLTPDIMRRGGVWAPWTEFFSRLLHLTHPYYTVQDDTLAKKCATAVARILSRFPRQKGWAVARPNYNIFAAHSGNWTDERMFWRYAESTSVLAPGTPKYREWEKVTTEAVRSLVDIRLLPIHDSPAWHCIWCSRLSVTPEYHPAMKIYNMFCDGPVPNTTLSPIPVVISPPLGWLNRCFERMGLFV